VKTLDKAQGLNKIVLVHFTAYQTLRKMQCIIILLNVLVFLLGCM